MRVRHPAIAARTGFTLVEMLVVIGIIAILMALVTPAIFLVRANARSTECKSNLRQFGIVFRSYADRNHGRLCSGAWGWTSDGAATEVGWVADAVNQNCQAGEMLCPANDARGSVVLAELMTKTASDFTTCNTGLGSAAATDPGGNPIMNPCRKILTAPLAAGSEERRALVENDVVRLGYNTNYTSHYYLTRTAPLLTGDYEPRSSAPACGTGLTDKAATVGPLSDSAMAAIPANTVPLLGDGGLSSETLTVALGQVPAGMPLAASNSGGPRRPSDGQPAIPTGTTRPARWNEWAASVQDYRQFGDHHGGTINFLWADGSVRALADGNEDRVLNSGFDAGVAPFADDKREIGYGTDQQAATVYSLIDAQAQKRH